MLPETRPISFVFTQAQFDEFARLSGDDNPIHVDPMFSGNTRFGRTVAHGMFLFSVMQGAVARAVGGQVRLAAQDLMFRAPTFTGDALQLTLSEGADGAVQQEITDSSQTITASGTAKIGSIDSIVPKDADLLPADSYKGLEVGMSATRVRLFTPDDVADYLGLVDDPNPLYRGPSPELPPSLLGGEVSWLLGVDLPGSGTNWLKQHFRFHRAVTVPAAVTTSVTITRLRPEQGLVNLSSTCSVDGQVAVSGETLVLAVDVAHR